MNDPKYKQLREQVERCLPDLPEHARPYAVDSIMQAFDTFHKENVEQEKNKAVAEELRKAERGFRAGLEGADEPTKHIMQPIVDVMKNRADRLEHQSTQRSES